MKNIVITILTVLVLCLGGYLVYDKVSEKNDKKIEDNMSKENLDSSGEEALDTYVAKEFIDKIIDSKVFNILDKLSENGLSEENKISLAIARSGVSVAYSCQDAFDIFNENNEYRISNQRWGCYKESQISSYTYDNVNQQYKKLFGSSKNAEKIGIYTTIAYEYSNKINAYVALDAYFGPIVSNEYYYNIESAIINDNKLNIVISYLSYFYKNLDSYLNKDSNSEVVYKLRGKEYTVKMNEVSTVFDNNKEALPHLTFSYEKQDGNYILKSVN